MQVKEGRAWYATNLCQWSECMPGTLQAFASEVIVCRVRFQFMQVK